MHNSVSMKIVYSVENILQYRCGLMFGQVATLCDVLEQFAAATELRHCQDPATFLVDTAKCYYVRVLAVSA